MTERTSFLRRAGWVLADAALRFAPAERREWASAMTNEIHHAPGNWQAFSWGMGCLRTSLAERFDMLRLPDAWPLLILLSLPLAAKVCSNLFATILTAAYRLGNLPPAKELGKMTPGDDDTRLIPLMKGIPVWIHALWVAGAMLYAAAFLMLLVRKHLSAVPVAVALLLEIAAELLGRPIIDAIGVFANPNRSIVGLVLPWTISAGIAACLWLMRPRRTLSR